MKLRFLPAMVLTLSLGLAPAAFAEDEPPETPRVLRIACVGDSITEGYGLPASQSWPSVMGRELGTGFEVRGFGVSGTCVNTGGEMPYNNATQPWSRFAASQAYQPDIVFFMLGGNDSHHDDGNLNSGNWGLLGANKEAAFKTSMRVYLDAYLALDSAPVVVIGTTPRAFIDHEKFAAVKSGNRTQYGVDNGNITAIAGWQKDVAAEYAAEYGGRVKLVDVNAWSQDKEAFYPDDGVHMSAAGYAAMAAFIRGALAEVMPAAVTLTRLPATRVFACGEPLDLSGGWLRADFDGVRWADVPLDAACVSVGGYDPARPGEQTLTVVCWGGTGTFTVTVLPPPLCGDVDGSGGVDSTDARMILQSEVGLVELDGDAWARADTDGDGSVDSTDARLVLQYEVKLIDRFPAEEAA